MDQLPKPLEEKELPAPPEEKELPAPAEEKLLREPTFAEKYSWVKPIVFIVLLVACIDIGIYTLLRSDNTPSQQPTTAQQQAEMTPLPTQQPTTIPMQTYTNTSGKFTLSYPKNYVLTETNGETQLSSDSIPELHTNFSMTIRYKSVVGTQTLEQLIEQNKYCSTVVYPKATLSVVNNTIPALLFPDLPCSQNNTTVIYTRSGDIFYTIAIESQAKFSEIKPYADKILATLQFAQ